MQSAINPLVSMNGSATTATGVSPQFVPPPQHAPHDVVAGAHQASQQVASASEALTREQRFEAALSCREEGKGVKPRQGCASVQLNRECKEGTRTSAFNKFLDVVRQTADNEVLSSYGTNSGSFDRADYMRVERPLQFAAQVTDKFFNSELWQRMIPRESGKGDFELRWLTRHVIAQHATAAKRQMRCNQIPRRTLQKLQMEHHRRNMQHAQDGVASGAAGGDPTKVGGRATDAGASAQSAAPWEKDKKVIQTTVARSRIESSLAAIQAQLRTGCVQGEVVHKTVQLTYALVFGTLGPMLQSVFNLSVLYQREFHLCQQVLCTIAGALTRLYGSAWHMSLTSILAPGMREFSIRLTSTQTRKFDRLEAAICFVWASMLLSAERNYVSQPMIDSWNSIPNGMWGQGRTDAVPGLQREEAAAAIGICSQSGETDTASQSDDSGSGESEAVSYVHPPAQYSEEKQRERWARRTDVSQNGMSAQNMLMGMSASEGRQAWSNIAPPTNGTLDSPRGSHPAQGAAAPTPAVSTSAAGAFDAPVSGMMPTDPYSEPATAQARPLPIPTALDPPPYAIGSYDGSHEALPNYKRQRIGHS